MLTLQRSTSIAVLLAAVVLAGCAKKDDTAVDTTASSSTAVTTAPAPINLADVAGTWNMSSVPTTGDATPTTSVVVATGNTSGWTITFPGGKPIPMRVTVDGDSIVTEVGPYASVRRKGVQVTTNGVWHLQNGSLVGPTTAHYKVKTADSVLVLNSTATRAQ
jgi:hypothetical protein